MGGTNSSTLVNSQSQHEQDPTTTTGEEDKTETADTSGENYMSGDEDDNENDDNNENSCDRVEEEGIEDSKTKLRKVMKKLKMKKKMR